MRRLVQIVLFVVLVLGPCVAAAQDRVRVDFPPPSLRIGEFRAELRVRVHFDLRDFDPELGEDETELRRARLVLQGRVYDDLEYEFDVDFANEDRPWRDVYGNYRRFRAAEIQFGRFKMPFSLDQNTATFSLNFIERSLIANHLSPARDRGVMVHGRLGGNVFRYMTGGFRGDGENTVYAGAPNEDRPEQIEIVDGTWAGRVELTPWDNSKGLLNSAQFGVNATVGTLLEGLYGLRGETLSGFDFAEPYYVKGRRLRFGADWRWTPGPVSVQAEYIRVSDERNGQGLGDVDLPDAIAQGWYVAGTWAITGENKTSGGLEPSRPFPMRGAGGIELAARYEELRFTSAGTGGEPPFSNPRAANILPNSDKILTLGVNWYLNRFGRVSVNGTRETLEDPLRTPIAGRTRFWGVLTRLQFVL
jgi:phosphate-selective porin OprO/OprP